MAGIEGLLQGRVLAERYRIEEVIGRGGMGAVYRATDERLGRRVAVKVITLSGAADPDTRERLQQRFLREARAAAGLPHHPNVVPVYDYGTDAALGLDYLVMELLRGEDLATHLARAGRVSVADAVYILHDAARGVAVGHRSGLVHRDVKPGNIFLVQDDGETQVRVLDFGIAKVADDDTMSQLTQDGRAPHSPAYAAPEQLRGLGRISPAADVFGLGAVGYLLLTGERPFSDEDRNRMSLGMPVAPVPPRERNPAIPPAVDEVIRKALAFDADDRFPDAGAFAAVLQQARREMGETDLPAGFAVVPPPPSRPLPPQDDRTEFLDDRTLLDPAAAAAPPREPAPPAPAVERQPYPLPPRRYEEPRSGMGTLLMALVALLLLGAGGVFAWWVLEGQGGRTAADIPPPPEEVQVEIPEPELPPQPSPLALEAVLANEEGRRHYTSADFDSARIHFQRAVQMMPDSATYRYNFGLALLRLGEVRQAEREFQRVLQQDPQRDGAHFYLGEARLALGDTASAIASMEQALQYAADSRQRGVVDRRLREIRAAVLQPPPPADEPAAAPPPGPAGETADALTGPPSHARANERARRGGERRPESPAP
jgi:eukaryotic-like serine/threonine-protein kinase